MGVALDVEGGQQPSHAMIDRGAADLVELDVGGIGRSIF